MMDLGKAAELFRNPPVLVYSILGQAWPELEDAVYSANLLALHGRVRHQSRRLADALAASEVDPGSRPDSRHPVPDERTYPPLDSRQYRFVFPDAGGPSMRRHLADGRKYLESLGFLPGGRGVLEESEFLLSGSPALDFLEIVVRDLIGIDRGVHGQQIRSVASVAFMLRNRILEVGTRDADPGGWAVLYFEKPGPPGAISYDIFRAALRTILEDHRERGSFPYAALHQRKLGLGRGAEFMLRIQRTAVSDAKLEEFLHDLFHEEGALEALRFALALQDEIPIPAALPSGPSGV